MRAHDECGARGGSLLLENVEVNGRGARSVRVEGGSISAIGPWAEVRQLGPADLVVDGRGGAVLAGLRDHHLHLLSMAARRTSVSCGPPAVTTVEGLRAALREAAQAAGSGRWVRGVGYDDSVAGPLSAASLDRILGDLADRRVRVQHRSGHAWILNGAAVHDVGLAELASQGVERTMDGTPTGVVFELDGWLGSRIGGAGSPELGPVGETLASFGLTAVTDATVGNGPRELALVVAAQLDGVLRQRVRLLGGAELVASPTGSVEIGQYKVMLIERDLPGFDELVGTIRSAGDRGVAIHCVSRHTLVLALAALAEVGPGPHRLEHASVAPPELVHLVRSVRACVVTQPAFVTEHGDRYLREVDDVDQPWLYRLAGWSDAGVALAAGSDAPFGPADPWVGIRAAVERRTKGGRVLGAAEKLTPEQALALYQSPLGDPGGAPARPDVGAPADLCVLALPWTDARRVLSSEMVLATVIGGELVWHRA